jgi:hypothetical protein
MKGKLAKAILIISAVGILFSIYLVISEILAPGYCPRIFQIPACFIVLFSFVCVLVSVFMSGNLFNLVLFFTGADIGIILAVWFSCNQITGLEECPRLFGLPLCFGSLAMFASLIIIKVKEIKKIP